MQYRKKGINMAERKKQSLLTGAGVLAIATVIVKLIGAVYKISFFKLDKELGYLRQVELCIEKPFGLDKKDEARASSFFGTRSRNRTCI